MLASMRLRSTARSPGTPMTTSWRSPVGSVTASTTFFRVSAAAHARSPRGAIALAQATSESMVGVSGVSLTSKAGASA